MTYTRAAVQRAMKVQEVILRAFGRALARLGIEHIVGYSPQARGRSERTNGTLQGRLVNELRALPAANRYLQERFIADYNTTFGRAPAEPASAFVPVGRHDLDQILCRLYALYAKTCPSRPNSASRAAFIVSTSASAT